jgi:hypothetical protein
MVANMLTEGYVLDERGLTKYLYLVNQLLRQGE